MKAPNQSSEIQVADAIKDLAAVRSAIDGAKVEKQVQSRVQIAIGLQTLLTTIALGFAGVEIFDQNQMTEFLRLSEHDTQLFQFSAAYMIGLLVLISGTAALIVASSARKNSESFATHLDRHLRVLSNFSIVSDLLVKFVFLLALLSTGHSAWVAPALFLFTGDYLIQRRVTFLNEGLALGLGVVSILFAAAQFMTSSPLLVFPLIWFGVVSMISVVTMIRITKAIK